MSEYNNYGEEYLITEEQLVQRRTVVALEKAAEQQRVTNVLLARLIDTTAGVRSGYAVSEIHDPDITDAFNDRLKSGDDLVHSLMDFSGEPHRAQWAGNPRVANGFFAARTAGGRVLRADAVRFPSFSGRVCFMEDDLPIIIEDHELWVSQAAFRAFLRECRSDNLSTNGVTLSINGYRTYTFPKDDAKELAKVFAQALTDQHAAVQEA